MPRRRGLRPWLLAAVVRSNATLAFAAERQVVSRMREGWHGSDYLILFEGEEISQASSRYGIASALPGFEVLGLRGWDDFIVRNESGVVGTVPTVPLDPGHLSVFPVQLRDLELRPDATRAGKIKWYVTPVIFGGDPGAGPNLIWVDHGQHAQLVLWWNGKYRELRSGSG
jgi:hypothetical protein